MRELWLSGWRRATGRLWKETPRREHFFDFLTDKMPAAVDQDVIVYQTWYCNNLRAEVRHLNDSRRTVFVLDESGSMGSLVTPNGMDWCVHSRCLSGRWSSSVEIQ